MASLTLSRKQLEQLNKIVEHFNEVENHKYVGYEINVDGQKEQWLMKNYGVHSIKLIIPQWVMNIKAESERHASNLFSKYLKIV